MSRALHSGLGPWVVALALLLVLGACAREPRPEQWLETAYLAHRGADEAVAGGRLDEARRQLEAVLRMPTPPGLAPGDERVVLQDVHFRLAEVGLLEGRPERALASADRGLELGRDTDVFTANLLVARGRALEALGEEPEAAAAYYEALRIDDELLRRIVPPRPEPVTP
jgi:tetratricopeptide (TPR) repeat protein